VYLQNELSDKKRFGEKEKEFFEEMQRKLEQEKETVIKVELAVVDLLIAHVVQYLTNEQLAAEDLAASLSSQTFVLTDTERINEALMQVQRLKTERFLQRRNLFSKITYMS
jgi:hypothetical protein